MSSQSLVTLCVGLVIGFILLFRVGRRSVRQPTTLNLKKSSARSSRSTEILKIVEQSISSDQDIKNLNVIFIYNGHSWDAFEVLGLPAGASMKMVNDSYHQLIMSADENSKNFIETAYQAIRNLQQE